MAQPYIGEIRMFGGNFAPQGWMLCNGQLLAIAENDALFNLIGTTYGGDGQSTFGLPDLRGRLPMHFGNGQIQGQAGGVETVTLTVPQIPGHGHAVNAASPSGQPSLSPASAVLAASTSQQPGTLQYSAGAPNITLHAATIGADGGSLPHANFQPYLCVNFIVSLFGIFPSQN